MAETVAKPLLAPVQNHSLGGCTINRALSIQHVHGIPSPVKLPSERSISFLLHRADAVKPIINSVDVLLLCSERNISISGGSRGAGGAIPPADGLAIEVLVHLMSAMSL